MKSFALLLYLFCVSQYSQSQGPTFEWAVNMGGPEYDVTYSVATDESGNVFATGVFSLNADFDPSTETYYLNAFNHQAAFVMKLDNLGNLAWVDKIGTGIADIHGKAIVTDIDGNVYTVGTFDGTSNFNPGSENNLLTSNGSNDIFLQKLDNDGNYIWAKNIGGTLEEDAESITIASNGDLFILGRFKGTSDFDPNEGTYEVTSSGIIQDSFVLKLDKDGVFQWVSPLGCSYYAEGNGVISDASGNVYVVGQFSHDLTYETLTEGVKTINSNGSYDTFIKKLDPSGNTLWLKHIESSEDVIGEDIVIDHDGNVLITGTFKETVDFDADQTVYEMTPLKADDAFLLKLDGDGNFIWAKQLEGYSNIYGRELETGNDGSIYMSGMFWNTADFDPGEATFYEFAEGGTTSIYVLKLDVDGNFIWVRHMEASNSENEVFDIHLDNNNNIYTAGGVRGTVDYNPNDGIHNLVTNGYFDAFVQKLSQSSIVTAWEVDDPDHSMIVYPNPAKDLLYINSINEGYVSISIKNAQGVMVLEHPTYNTSLPVNIATLKKGLYIIEIKGDHFIESQKFVVN